MASTSKRPRLDVVLRELDGRDDSQLLPKHTTFLCHAGAQKAFVEQLYVDLKSRGQSPFFDQESLPKGEVFAKRIFEAAKQCLVAVVVLSNEFLLSQWPMLELAAFVEAQETCNPKLKVFPLFYKLEVSDLKDPEATNTRMAKWKDMAAVEKRINPDAWQNAVSALARANGEVFSKYDGSEVKYRKAIVDAICNLCRPYVQSSVPSMVGRDRLCNIIEGEFEKLAYERDVRGPGKLGLYGMGGMGKTFICKALCDHFNEKYFGRVCYVEYSNGEYLELLKLILEELTDVSEKSLRRIRTIEEADGFLEKFLPKQDVFLALDNLQDDDLDWPLLKYLSTKSKVVVTSRSLVNVKRVLGDNALCLAVPTLTLPEVLKLFVQSAGCTQPLTEMITVEEMEILMKCTELSFFKNGSDSSEKSEHYNPLVLVAMGTTIKDDNAIEPKQLLEKCSRIQNLHQNERRTISDIFITNYYTLTTGEKQLFVDVTLLYPIINLADDEFVDMLDRLLSWLEAVDGSPRRQILHKLGKLKDFNRAWDSHKRPLRELLPLYIFKVMNMEGAEKLIAGDREGAVQCTNKAIEILSLLEGSEVTGIQEVIGSEDRGTVYLTRGIARLQLQDFRKSLEDMEKANQFLPDNAFALKSLGEARAGLRQLEGAMEAVNRAIHIDPNSASSFAARATVKFLANDPKGAMMDIDESFRLEPGNAGAMVILTELKSKQL